MRRIALVLSLSVPLFAACGDDEELPDICATDADCPDLNPVCDFRNGQCVSGCNEASDCSGEFPVCNNDGANTNAPSVCVCSTDSCSPGEACLEDGSCGIPASCGMAGEQGICPTGQICQPDGTCADSCGDAGTQGNCGAGEVCMPNGSCEAACDNGDATTGCLATLSLCDTSTNSMTFNDCIAPQEETARSCPNAQNHSRADGGPVVVAVAAQGNVTPETMNCDDDALYQFTADVYAPDGLPASFNSMGIKRLDPDGSDGFVYSDGPGTSTHPSFSPVSGMDGRFTVQFTICATAPDATLGMFVNDTDGEASNAACFMPQ